MTTDPKATVVTPLGHKLGVWRPEPPSNRDYRFKMRVRGTLPRKVDPMGWDFRRHDQRDLSACTGFGTGTPVEVVMGWDGDAAQLSPMDIYRKARAAIGETDRDDGAYIRDCFGAIIGSGVCHETKFRYSKANLFKAPGPRAVADAAKVRDQLKAAGVVYERLNGLADILNALALGCPVTFGYMVPERAFRLNKDRYFLDPPLDSDWLAGGHCSYMDGYDMERNGVWVGGSWGKKYGINGYTMMHFDWFTHPWRLVDDVWAVRKGGAAQ